MHCLLQRLLLLLWLQRLRLLRSHLLLRWRMLLRQRGLLLLLWLKLLRLQRLWLVLLLHRLFRKLRGLVIHNNWALLLQDRLRLLRDRRLHELLCPLTMWHTRLHGRLLNSGTIGCTFGSIRCTKAELHTFAAKGISLRIGGTLCMPTVAFLTPCIPFCLSPAILVVSTGGVPASISRGVNAATTLISMPLGSVKRRRRRRDGIHLGIVVAPTMPTRHVWIERRLT